eukprot:6214758-Pleurochrysis_carterae.AAC.1
MPLLRLLSDTPLATGYLMESQGLVIDEKGQDHTQSIAKGPRMLGGNSQMFPDTRDACMAFLANKKFEKATAACVKDTYIDFAYHW